MLPYRDNLKPNARHLRAAMTDAEHRLWSRLRGKQLYGVQFYRQKPLGDFIVDFYCAAAGLVVEVDGGQHFESAGIARDRRRDDELAALGLAVLRFDNRQVLAETDAVVTEIARVVADRLPMKSPPAPLLQRGESSLGDSSPGRAEPPTPLLQRGESTTAMPTVPPFAKGGTGGISDNAEEHTDA